MLNTARQTSKPASNKKSTQLDYTIIKCMLFSTISAYVTALTHLAIIHKLKTFVNYISTKWHTFPRQILFMCHRKDLGQTLRHPSPLPDPRLKGTLQIIITQAARHFFFFLNSKPDFTAYFKWLCYCYSTHILVWVYLICSDPELYRFQHVTLWIPPQGLISVYS